MSVDLFQSLQSRRSARHAPARIGLVSCSVCLRVLRGSNWVEAEHVIREIRSFELEAPPRLQSGVCDGCAESIFTRRLQGEAVAA